MKRRSLLSALVVGTCTLASGTAVAGEAEDYAAVKDASHEFYRALEILDDGTAMAGVWVHAPYVTMVGPRSKDIVTGWDAVAGYWKASNAKFKVRHANVVEARIHVNGNVAWEVGREKGDVVMADDSKRDNDWVVTNIYERQADGKWLMASHHVQPGAP